MCPLVHLQDLPNICLGYEHCHGKWILHLFSHWLWGWQHTFWNREYCHGSRPKNRPPKNNMYLNDVPNLKTVCFSDQGHSMARANLKKNENFATNTYYRSIRVHTQETQNLHQSPFSDLNSRWCWILALRCLHPWNVYISETFASPKLLDLLVFRTFFGLVIKLKKKHAEK